LNKKRTSPHQQGKKASTEKTNRPHTLAEKKWGKTQLHAQWKEKGAPKRDTMLQIPGGPDSKKEKKSGRRFFRHTKKTEKKKNE